MREGEGRIVMGYSLSPRDAEEIAEIGGAELEATGPSSFLRFRGNNWMIGVGHIETSPGEYLSSMHASYEGAGLPSQPLTDRALVLVRDRVTIVDIRISNGASSLRKMVLSNGMLQHETTLSAENQDPFIAEAAARVVDNRRSSGRPRF